jgi:hypothetical protein
MIKLEALEGSSVEMKCKEEIVSNEPEKARNKDTSE